MASKDPSPDIYQIMDKVHLNSAHFLQGKKGMPAIVNELRANLAQELKTYIEERDNAIRSNQL